MKNLKRLLLVVLAIIISTGCVKFNANLDIKEDKSMEFNIIYAFDKTIFGEESIFKDEDIKEIEKEGFTVSKYSEGNMQGFTLSRKIKNIDDVSTEVDTTFNLSGLVDSNSENKYLFKVVKGDKKNTYYAKFKFDSNDSGLNTNNSFDDELPDESSDDSNINDLDFSGMMANLDLSFSVNLPYSAISNNATTKENDNKKLSWKLTTEKAEYIEFAFEMPNNNGGFDMTIVFITLGVLVLVIAIMLIIMKTKNNKKSLANNNQTDSLNNVNNDNVTPIDQSLNTNQATINENN